MSHYGTRDVPFEKSLQLILRTQRGFPSSHETSKLRFEQSPPYCSINDRYIARSIELAWYYWQCFEVVTLAGGDNVLVLPGGSHSRPAKPGS